MYKKQIIDFYADWCGPCKAIKPFFKYMETKFPDIEFLSINVDELTQDELEQYKVSCMPTFLYMINDVEVDRLEGANMEQLEAKLVSLNAV